eukprot:GDKK01064263.1.p1 GENE.GDKK01064263.1~~GDKK01064263.1.p1  ORF type:complete len:362 (+),score=8.28 GDKK01064263.1:63-1148(+)
MDPSPSPSPSPSQAVAPPQQADSDEVPLKQFNENNNSVTQPHLQSSSASTTTTVIEMPSETMFLKDFEFNPASLLTLPQQAIRLVLYLIVGFFLLANALNFTNSRMPPPGLNPPLPDLGFDITPKWNIEPLTNVCVGILNALNIFTVYKLFLHSYGSPLLPIFPAQVLENPLGKFLLCPPQLDVHPQKWLEHFIRFAATYATVLYVRCIVITVTVLPATDNHCQTPVPIDSWWGNVFLTIVTMGGGSIHCGDLLFSGHMTIICASALSIVFYGRYISKIFPIVALATFAASWFTILSSRSHYTDDIVVAAGFTTLFYAVFWMGGENPEPGRMHSIRGAPLWLQCILAPISGYRYLTQTKQA